MTTNAFIFSWNMYGIESIIPITHYEKDIVIDTLSGKTSSAKKELNSIVFQLKLRARFNNQRKYEIYAIDCTPELDEEFWKKEWEENPKFIANLIREKGIKLHSDRDTNTPIIT